VVETEPSEEDFLAASQRLGKKTEALSIKSSAKKQKKK
jgi:hypothetical protein